MKLNCQFGSEMEVLKLMIYRFLLVWTTTTFLAPSATGALPAKTILILGGNGFLGSQTTTSLLENGHNVTLLNRGNTYFDSEIRIKSPMSRHITCDREKSILLECKELKDDSAFYDVVIDFTSFSPKQMLQAVQLLRGRVGLYIFISSGAVYQVSSKNNSKPSREEEAVRPISPKRRRELQKEEPYGDQKLACEEVLEEQEKEGGFPFISLRLSVAIGPRDTTFRWWIYQLWVLTHEVIHYPVHIPDGIRSNLFSLVHVDDVADVISRIVAMDESRISSVKNMAFNLALREHITLPRIIKDIAKYYGIDHVQYEGDNNSTWYVYPPGAKALLDISLAQRVLDWDPMPWKEAMKTTCDFHHRAMTNNKYLKEKEMVLADILEDVVPDEYYDAFLMKLKQHFGHAVLDGINLEGGIPEGDPEIETMSSEANFKNGGGKIINEL